MMEATVNVQMVQTVPVILAATPSSLPSFVFSLYYSFLSAVAGYCKAILVLYTTGV